MQAIARDGLDAAEVKAIVEAANLELDFGADLLDGDDGDPRDITDDLIGGSVARGMLDAIHGTCRLTIAREIDWRAERIRPWMRLTTGGKTFRAYQGVYLLSTPRRNAGETPRAYEVEGYDKLLLLDTPVGTAFEAPAGDGYMQTVLDLIAAVGETNVLLVGLGNDKSIPTTLVWPPDEQNTYLSIINELLASIGYRGVWVDELGRFRAEPYLPVANLAAGWTFDADDELTTIVGLSRTEEQDFFKQPNEWVGVIDDPERPFPTEGAGLYTIPNTTTLPTFRRVERLDAADDAALKVQLDRIAAEDRIVPQTLTLTSGPLPLVGHFDIYRVRDSELGIDRNYIGQRWTLDLVSGAMTHDLRTVS